MRPFHTCASAVSVCRMVAAAAAARHKVRPKTFNLKNTGAPHPPPLLLCHSYLPLFSATLLLSCHNSKPHLRYLCHTYDNHTRSASFTSHLPRKPKTFLIQRHFAIHYELPAASTTRLLRPSSARLWPSASAADVLPTSTATAPGRAKEG